MEQLVVKNLIGKIATLERRLEFLRSEIKKRREERTSSEKAENYIIAEINALEGGISALRFHHLAMSTELSPYIALEELLEQLGKLNLDKSNPEFSKLFQSVVHARVVIEAKK